MITALLFCGLAQADSGDDPKKHEYCKELSRLAAKIMEARQAGVSVSKVMEITVPENHQMVVVAYESPRFNTASLQRRAIEDFENEAYLVCFRNKNS
jgi:hypothetical protein